MLIVESATLLNVPKMVFVVETFISLGVASGLPVVFAKLMALSAVS